MSQPWKEAEARLRRKLGWHRGLPVGSADRTEIADRGGSWSFYQETVSLDQTFPISGSNLEIQGS